MTYKVIPSEEIKPKLGKLKKKDPVHFQQLSKKLIELGEKPDLGKPLGYGLKHSRRSHQGHFVFIYSIDEKNKLIILEDYDHHDNVYKH